MHGGQLVEELGLNDLQPRLEQLGADGQRHHAPSQEHDEAEPQVQRADILMIGGAYPAHQAGRMMVVMVVVPNIVIYCCHDFLLMLFS